jgi:hypothetical protein
VLDFFLLELFFSADFLVLLDFLVAIGVLPFTPVGSRRRTRGCSGPPPQAATI